MRILYFLLAIFLLGISFFIKIPNGSKKEFARRMRVPETAL